jgi:hypothetical protein
MITYSYEVAPWCPTNMHDPERFTLFPALDRVLGDPTLDEIAIDLVVKEHLPKDADTWAQIPEDLAKAAWDNDGRTVAAWNVTGPRGTYQVRLARTATP